MKDFPYEDPILYHKVAYLKKYPECLLADAKVIYSIIFEKVENRLSSWPLENTPVILNCAKSHDHLQSKSRRIVFSFAAFHRSLYQRNVKPPNSITHFQTSTNCPLQLKKQRFPNLRSAYPTAVN